MRLKKSEPLLVFLENERQRINVEIFLADRKIPNRILHRCKNGVIFYIKTFFNVFMLGKSIGIVYPRQRMFAWIFRLSDRVSYIEDGLNFTRVKARSRDFYLNKWIGHRALHFAGLLSDEDYREKCIYFFAHEIKVDPFVIRQSTDAAGSYLVVLNGNDFGMQMRNVLELVEVADGPISLDLSVHPNCSVDTIFEFIEQVDFDSVIACARVISNYEAVQSQSKYLGVFLGKSAAAYDWWVLANKDIVKNQRIICMG